MDQSEKRGGNVVTKSQIADMHHFMDSNSLMDLESKGLYFKWFNKQYGGIAILKRLDPCSICGVEGVS